MNKHFDLLHLYIAGAASCDTETTWNVFYLNTAECWGPRRIRSLSAASWRDRDGAGAEPRAFSSRRKEMRRGNKMATS